MRRVFVLAVAGLGLAGCSSFSLDVFKSTPPPLQVQLDSNPQGADASTSLGPGCKTPCSVSVTAPESGGFSVTYTLNKFQPATVQVNVAQDPRRSHHASHDHHRPQSGGCGPAARRPAAKTHAPQAHEAEKAEAAKNRGRAGGPRISGSGGGTEPLEIRPALRL